HRKRQAGVLVACTFARASVRYTSGRRYVPTLSARSRESKPHDPVYGQTQVLGLCQHAVSTATPYRPSAICCSGEYSMTITR
ncbi:hypothetical protein AHF37_12128, partial [Paragonimus kellicotti]